jgi:hypothetical protein
LAIACNYKSARVEIHELFLSNMSIKLITETNEENLIVPNVYNGHVSQCHNNLSFEQKQLNNGKTIRTLDKSLKFVFYNRTEDLPSLDDTQGVYFLYKYHPKSRVIEGYIGKSRDLERRQDEHGKKVDKDCFTSAVIITLPGNAFTESDASNLENALYLHLKRSKGVILHNSTIPSACKSYDVEDNSILLWSDKIVNCVFDYIFGETKIDFGLKSSSEICYDYIKSGKSSLSIEKIHTRQTFNIEAGSILHIPERLDGVTKARYANIIKANKFIELLEDVSTVNDKFYRFNESLRVKDSNFEDFFPKKMSGYYFRNNKGDKLKG